jgi:hypothetical protein
VEEPDGKLGSLPTEHALALHPAVEPLKGEPEGGKGQAGEEEVPPTAAEEELQEVLHRLRERLLLAELLLKLLRGDAELRGEILLTRLPLLAEALEIRRERRIGELPGQLIQVVEGFLGKTELFLVALDLRAQLAEFARTCGQPPDLVQHRTEEIEDPLPPVQLDLRLLGGGLLERDPGGDPIKALPQLGQLLPKGFDPLSQFLPTPFPPWTA